MVQKHFAEKRQILGKGYSVHFILEAETVQFISWAQP